MAPLLLLLLALPLRAGAPEPAWIGKRPPELAGKHLVWFNGPPVTLASLRGKVVLLDIWDGTCINCLRTLPYLRAWHQRYAPDGLRIIGIHCPEFAFEQDPAIVREFIAAQGLRYPVVADNAFEIWKAFGNAYWPRKWLIDRDGIIRADHAGEGDYGRTEERIQGLLRALHPGRVYPPPLAAVRPEDAPGAVCYPRSDELYLGAERGSFGGPGPVTRGRAAVYRDAPRHVEGSYYLRGAWTSRPQCIRSMANDAALLIRFHGTEVNVVLRSDTAEPLAVRVTLDGADLTERDRGEDVAILPSGESRLTVRRAGMFRVIRTPAFGHHELAFAPSAPGLEAYVLTFGSCVVPR